MADLICTTTCQACSWLVSRGMFASVLWPDYLEISARDDLNLVIEEKNQRVKCMEGENIPCRQ